MSINMLNIDILRNKKVYISGPMTGIQDFNYPAFARMHDFLAQQGIQTLNPCHIANGDTSKPYDFYIRESLIMVAKAGAIVMLDGWQKSRGAKLEHHCAQAMEIPILDENFHLLINLVSVENTEIDVIAKAKELITGARQASYGSPKSNFSTIGRIWGAINDIPDIAPEKVALMMAGLKIARESFLHGDDNIVDGIGYLGTIPMIRTDKE